MTERSTAAIKLSDEADRQARRLRAALPRWGIAIALIVLFAYGAFIAVHCTALAGGSDSSGYLNSAKLLAGGRLTADARPIPELHAQSTFDITPLGFTREPGSLMLRPTYPTGMPLQFAGAGAVFGPTAGIVVVCVANALGAIALCYAVARRFGLAPLWSGIAAGMLAIDPVFVFIAIQPLSDVSALTWTLAAVYAALRAREHGRWAWVCGIAAAMAVLVRPSNVLIFPALLLILPRWRTWLFFAAGGVPGAVWLLFYQYRLYGDPLASGYGDVSELFRWVHVGPTFAHYARWLPQFVPAVVLLTIAAALVERRHLRRSLIFVLWAVPVLVFYACYEVTKEAWWCLRFLLPVLPALTIAGLLGAEALTRRLSERWARRGTLIAAAGIVAWAAVLGWRSYPKLDPLAPSRYERVFVDAAQWAKGHLPENAIVASMVASGSLFYYTDFAVLRWDMISSDEFAALARASERRQPIYALLFTEEEERAFTQHLPGEWSKVHETPRATIWKLAAGP